MEKFNLIILGPQGSGKGTQAQLLAKKFKLEIIAPGEMSREEIAKHSTIGQKIKKFVERGSLIPDNLIEKMIAKAIKKRYGYIFDGFPRNLDQLMILKKMITEKSLLEPYMIYLKISKETAIKRLSQRKVCLECGQIYHPDSIFYQKGICKKCQIKLVKREDDSPQAIKQRLKIYYEETERIISYFQKENRLLEINGELSIDKVFEEILKKIHSVCRIKND